MTRLKACVVSGTVLWLLSLLTVCSFAGVPFTQFDFMFVGKQVHNLFEVIDHLTSDILLPLCGLAMAIFAGWILKREVTSEELNASALTYSIWRFAIRWVTPVAVLAVFLNLTGVLQNN